MGRRLFASALLLGFAGCEPPAGSSPAPSPLTFATGTYTISVSNEGATCVATGQAPAQAMSMPATIEQRGSDSVFVPVDQPGATFEFWIHRTKTNGTDILVNGQVLGSVRISSAPVVNAEFALGVVSGTTNLTQGNGVIFGQVRFADTNGNALTCTNLRWAFVRN